MQDRPLVPSDAHVESEAFAAGRPALALALLLSAGFASCARERPGPDAPAVATALPADAVLRLDGRAVVTAAEVDEWTECMGFIETNASYLQKRRLALWNVVVPRAVARDLDRARYEETRQRARSIRARLLDGGQPGVDTPPSEVVTGTWKDLGLDVWWKGREARVGEWSEPLESVGCFWVWRLVAEPERPVQPGSQISVERIFLPYVPTEAPGELVEQAMLESKLEVLDPEWEQLVPLLYRNEMRAELIHPQSPPTEPEHP